MMIAVIFIPFFAQNIQTLFAGQLLAGIPWGIFQTLVSHHTSTHLPPN
jgi:SP family general alpha glucoside:H+ symporter-like MFS transporter